MDVHTKKILGLLRRLGSANSGHAWEEFLHLHAALIMNSVLRFEFREERKNDCFLYVCEKLAEKDFRRLRSYRHRAGVKFTTWLTAVVFNLCVDWHRREFGRATLLPAISALPSFDKQVYRCYFERGLSGKELLEALRPDFPEADEAMLARSLARVHQLMTPRQRWQAGIKLARRQRRDRSGSRDPDKLTSPVVEPFAVVSNQQEIDLLDEAMQQLSQRERLMLQLRFQEGFTLIQIADQFELGDTNRAWRQLQDALNKLAAIYPGGNFKRFRKS